MKTPDLALALAFFAVRVRSMAPLDWSTGESLQHAGSPALQSRSDAQNGPYVLGIDVSSETGDVDMKMQASLGAKFVYVRSTYFDLPQADPNFDFMERVKIDEKSRQHFFNASTAGLIAGGYHEAQPGTTCESASLQARFFIANGGSWCGWTRSDRLPGALKLAPDLSWPGRCDHLRPPMYQDWVWWFVHSYWEETERMPVVLLSRETFDRCFEGSMAGFEAVPFWIQDGDIPLPGNLYESWVFRQTVGDQPPRTHRLRARQTSPRSSQPNIGRVDHYNLFRGDDRVLQEFARFEPVVAGRHMWSLSSHQRLRSHDNGEAAPDNRRVCVFLDGRRGRLQPGGPSGSRREDLRQR